MREVSKMPAMRVAAGDEWELGPEPQEEHEHELGVGTQPKADLSALRLTRSVQVVTVEHLAWSGLAVWAVITRFLELGMAPLAPNEARHALFEFDLVNRTHWASEAGYHPVWAGWVHLVEAALFATGGTSDSAARLIFVVAGVSMIAVAYLMRPYMGRAGAIALAGLITASPTFTYFSRTSAITIVAAALAMVVIEVFMASTRRPTLLGAIGLGCASGLMCATSAAGLAAGGILLAAMILLGVYQLIVSDRRYLNVRVWLERYASLLAAGMVAAVFSGLGSQIVLFKFAEIAKTVEKVWNGFGTRDYLAGLQYYTPGILLYEFMITLAAVTGLFVAVSLRAWSRLALFSLLWLGISFAYFLGSDQRQSERLVLMLLPLVTMGALGIDYLHHTRAWPYARMVLAGLSVATVYVQVLTNFMYAAPVANETPWGRHANLYWREGATPIEARAYLAQIRRQFPEEGGTVFNVGIWQPSLRWYLRDFRSTRRPKVADLVINPNPAAIVPHNSDLEKPFSIDLEESWQPTPDILTPALAIRFVFTADAPTPLQNSKIAIFVRPLVDLGTTLIIPPPSH